MGTSESVHVLNSKFAETLKQFSAVRRKTEELCRPLMPEDYMLSVTEETSPPKWHLAHTSWFFEHFILEPHSPGYEAFSPEFNFLFNSYYKKVGAYLPKSKRAFLSRPSVEEVYQYRHYVTENMMNLLDSVSDDNQGKFIELLEVGINHEQQHQELLLMDIKRNFFENPARPRYHEETVPQYEAQSSSFRTFHAGMVKIGIPTEYQEFAFDNEKDQHQVWVENFQLASHLVTNGEYLSFIEAGGYEDPSFWLSDGWDVKEKQSWRHPLYWEKQGESWWVMTLSGMVPLDLAAPVVHVSYYEAYAFAKWRGCRLPTEVEWETAARLENIEGQFLENGSYEPESAEFNSEHFSQIHGSVWEWTMSAYAPYPRYQPLGNGMNEYNEKFMCNQFVLRGGCSITPKSHYRLTYRNFYYPYMRWQFAGIRLAKDLP